MNIVLRSQPRAGQTIFGSQTMLVAWEEPDPLENSLTQKGARARVAAYFDRKSKA
jgi:hypothetical protein